MCECEGVCMYLHKIHTQVRGGGEASAHLIVELSEFAECEVLPSWVLCCHIDDTILRL